MSDVRTCLPLDGYFFKRDNTLGKRKQKFGNLFSFENSEQLTIRILNVKTDNYMYNNSLFMYVTICGRERKD